jgi:hypothetical protein
MEPQKEENKSIRDHVLGKIRSKEVAMRSRAYFTVKIAILAAVALAILVISAFLFNIILFGLRLNGHESLLGFGSRGILLFFSILPWWLLVFDILLIVLLEWLIRHFRFGSRSPVIYIVLGILVVVVCGGFYVDRATDWNDRLLEQADANDLPPFLGDVYEHARRPMPPESGFCKCLVTSINGENVIVQDIDNGTTTMLTLEIPGDDSGAATTTDLQVGDLVIIAGDRVQNVIKAFGIHKIHPGRPR